MPQIEVVGFREADGSVPIREWLNSLPAKVRDKCTTSIRRLRELGYELRRPEADYLRDGIYELRVRLRRQNYRMLYFFHGSATAVVSHGLVKEKQVPPKEIDQAIRRMNLVLQNPERHTFAFLEF